MEKSIWLSKLRKEDKLSYERKLLINHPQFKLKKIIGFQYVNKFKIDFECEGIKYKFSILSYELEVNNV